MLTLESWKKERQEYLRKVDRFEIPEEEWRDFLSELTPIVESDLPQSRKEEFVNVAYPTIYQYISSPTGKEKLQKRIIAEFHRASFAIVISNILIQKPTFIVEYIIGEKTHVEP